jgi:hypothetical protein
MIIGLVVKFVTSKNLDFQEYSVLTSQDSKTILSIVLTERDKMRLIKS